MFLHPLAPVVENTAAASKALRMRIVELEGQLADAIAAHDDRRCRIKELELALEDTRHSLEDGRRRSDSLHGAELAQYALATKVAQGEARTLEAQLAEARQAAEHFERLYKEVHESAAASQRGQEAEIRRHDFLRIPELTKQARAGQEAEERVASLESELEEAQRYGRTLEERLEGTNEATGMPGYHFFSSGSLSQSSIQGDLGGQPQLPRKRHVHFEDPFRSSTKDAGCDNEERTLLLEELTAAQRSEENLRTDVEVLRATAWSAETSKEGCIVSLQNELIEATAFAKREAGAKDLMDAKIAALEEDAEQAQRKLEERRRQSEEERAKLRRGSCHFRWSLLANAAFLKQELDKVEEERARWQEGSCHYRWSMLASAASLKQGYDEVWRLAVERAGQDAGGKDQDLGAELSRAKATIRGHEEKHEELTEAKQQQRNRFDLAQELHQERLSAIQSELHLEQKALRVAETQQERLGKRLSAAERTSAEEMHSASRCLALQSELEDMRRTVKAAELREQDWKKQQQETSREREANESLRGLLEAARKTESLRSTKSCQRMQVVQETEAKMEAQVAEREEMLALMDVKYSELESRLSHSEQEGAARAGELESELRTIRSELADATEATQRYQHSVVTALNAQETVASLESLGRWDPNCGGRSCTVNFSCCGGQPLEGEPLGSSSSLYGQETSPRGFLRLRSERRRQHGDSFAAVQGRASEHWGRMVMSLLEQHRANSAFPLLSSVGWG